MGRPEYNRKNSLRNSLYVREFLNQHPCEDCWETNPLFLDFHHKDPKEKKLNVAVMVWKAFGLKRIQSEIDKCNVLCCKCHRQRHFQEWLALKKYIAI